MSAQASLSWRQIRTFTAASIKSRYRNTFAGVIWVVLSPLLMFGAQGYAFKYVLRINFENYPLFLLTGLVPWIFLMQSIGMGTSMIVSQSRLLKSFPIHPLVCLTSMLLDNLINFTLTFVMILVPLLFFTSSANPAHFLLLPLPLLSLFIAAIGLVWFLSVMQVFFYDTRFVVDFLMGVAFYLTPIFYPPEFVGEELRWILYYNPLHAIFAPIQALARPELPDDFFVSVGISYAVSCGMLLLASIFWSRKKNLLYFRL